MKSSIIAGAVGTLALTAAAVGSPFQGFTVQTMGTDLVAGTVTYRVFANIDAGSRIDAVYGNSLGTLSISAGEGKSFYQDGFGGATSTAINQSFFALAPTLEWDSYVSIGALYSNGGGGFSSNALNDVGLTDAKVAFEAGNALVSDNGSWFVTSDDAQGAGVPTEQVGTYGVFIGQFTINGGTGDVDADLLGTVNLQGKAIDGSTWNEVGVSWNAPIPAPGALALLGLAGLAGSRRRRA